MRTNAYLLIAAMVTAGCGGPSPKAALDAARSAFNPPPPPPDTVPEMLDYAADLQVNVSEMAKRPEGILWEDILTGTGKEAAEGDSLELAWYGWLPNGLLVDSGVATFR
ncbi:MAG: hypothetical protein HOP28_18435, partial [Gemmatimonadales bacterium]|nr:hypothetical protein [Gemmatimonadales bacterium]